MSHNCDEMCSMRATPDMLTARGLPVRIQHVESSMGVTTVTVIQEGMPLSEARRRATLQPMWGFRVCLRPVLSAPVVLPQGSPGMLEWAMSRRVVAVV